MKVTAGLLVDFGNSESRVTVLANKKEKEMFFSNVFAKLPKNYGIASSYQNDKSTVIELNGENYVNGLLAEREFSKTPIRPTSLRQKNVQETTKLTLNLAMARAIMYLEEAYNTDASELEVTFNVSVVIPPLECKTSIEKMEAVIREIDHVHIMLPKHLKKTVTIKDVRINPEGVTAFFGAFFNEVEDELVEEEKNLDFESGYVLVMDIGAGTTDLALMLDSLLVENSMETFRVGGNTVGSTIENLIRLNYNNHTPTTKEMVKIITTGYMPYGNRTINVIDLINSAKKDYARDMIEKLTKYLERLSIDIGSLKGLLVVGGGSLPIKTETGEVLSPAMAELILEFLNELNSMTEAMYIGDKNPRLLNMLGLKFMHKYE